MNLRKLSLIGSVLLIFSGCANLTTPKSPDFYPNEEYRRSPGAAEAASRECMSLADEYVRSPNRYQEMAKEGLIGGAVGAGTGALGGTIMGSKVGRATAAGAAIGGILGVLNSAKDFNDRDPSYERFVERCLQQRGFEVIGWSSK